MLTDAKLQKPQSNHNCYTNNNTVNHRHGPCVDICVSRYATATLRCAALLNTLLNTLLNLSRALHSKRQAHTLHCNRQVTEQTAPVGALTRRSFRSPERCRYPALLNQTPRKHQGYTPYHSPAH